MGLHIVNPNAFMVLVVFKNDFWDLRTEGGYCPSLSVLIINFVLFTVYFAAGRNSFGIIHFGNTLPVFSILLTRSIS